MLVPASCQTTQAQLLEQLQQHRHELRDFSGRVAALEQQVAQLMPPAAQRLNEAWRAGAGIAPIGAAQAERAWRFGAAAMAAPVAAPVIGNDVAGAAGVGIGAGLGCGKAVEFMALSGSSASQAVWLPPYLAGEAAWKGLEAAVCALLGNPGFNEQMHSLQESLSAATAGRDAAQRRAAATAAELAAAFGAAAVPLDAAPAQRNKVLIFSLSAGGGHDAATRAITDALEATYDIVVVKPYDQGADVYNAAQSHAPPGTLDMFGYAQQITDSLNECVGVSDLLYAERLDHIMRTHRPSLVISTAPMENAATWRAASRHGVPMMVVPTDLHFTHFVRTIQHPNDKFRLLLPFASTRNQAAHLPDRAVCVTGYPVRGAFATPQPSPILDTLNIAADDRVIMLMMGAMGSAEDVVVHTAHTIAAGLPELLARRPDAPPTVHLVVLCGGNQGMAQRLSEFPQKRASRVRLHALGRRDADDVAALMRKADALITKPGGSTVNEALAVGLPMIFLSQLHVVHWEMGNASFAAEHDLAHWADEHQVVGAVDAALKRGRPAPRLDCPARNFPDNLRRAVAEMLAEKTEAV